MRFCPKCNTERQCTTVLRIESYPTRGDEIEIESNVLICSECGEDIFDKKLDSENIKKIYSAYREKHGLLSPDDIRAIRVRYGLSQRGMSRFLGWGEVTLHRYESGGLPDRVHNDLLKMISTHEGMEHYLKESGSNIPAAEHETVISALRTATKKFSLKEVFETMQADYGASITTGYRTINMMRLENMVLFFSENGVWKTKLNKLLWYSDFVAFRRNTCSISGLAYQREVHGPVPFRFFTMLDALGEENLIDTEEIDVGTYGVIKITAKRKADLSIFSASEIDVLMYVSHYFSTMTSTAISNKSHDERAWIETPQGDLISYNYSEVLSIQ